MAGVMRVRNDVWFVRSDEVFLERTTAARPLRAFVGGGRRSGRICRHSGGCPSVVMALDLLVHMPTVNPQRHTEAFGMNVAEAMGCGFPVVATAVGGLPEVVEDGITGMLAPDRRVDLIAKAILGLSDDSESRRGMGEAGQHCRRTRFAQRKEVDQFQDLHEELVRTQQRD